MNIVDDDVIMVCKFCDAFLWIDDETLMRVGETAQEDCSACATIIKFASS